MAPIQFPTINGIRFDYSSIQTRVNGVLFPGFKSVNYNHALDPGLLRGSMAQVYGRTRGQYNAEGSIEVFREDAEQFLTLIAPGSTTQVAPGFMEVAFDIQVAFSETNPAGIPSFQMDILTGCRIKKEDASQSAGSDPLTLKYDLHIMMLLRNGKAPIAASLSNSNLSRG